MTASSMTPASSVAPTHLSACDASAPVARVPPSGPSGLSHVLHMPDTILHAPGAERRLSPTGHEHQETVTGATGGELGLRLDPSSLGH